MEPDLKTRLTEAALPHVAFDGWSDTTFRAACDETGTDPALARLVAPRGAIDLALEFHAMGDRAMLARLRDEGLSALRFRDRVAFAVRARIEASADREVVRRGMSLLSLPPYAADGSKALWGTADAIWNALGDTSEDLNWYTKRAILSGVYGASVLFWLGDASPGHSATWEFVDRRIADVMRIEEAKKSLRGNPLTRPLMAGSDWLSARVRKPLKPQQMPDGLGRGGRV